MALSLEKVEYRQLIIIIAGHPYSGKSTLGKGISDGTNITSFDNNDFRKVFPLGGGEFKNALVRSAAMNIAYSETEFHAMERLVEGDHNPVAIVGTFAHRAYVTPVRELADYYQRLYKYSEPMLQVIVLESPEECLAERVANRNPNSSNYVSLEDAIRQRNGFMPIEGSDVVHIDTGRLNKDQTLALAFDSIESFRKR